MFDDQTWDVFAIIRQARTWISGRHVVKRNQQQVKRPIAYGTVYQTFRRLEDSNLIETRYTEDDVGRVKEARVSHQGRGIHIPPKQSSHRLGIPVPVKNHP